MAQKRGYSREFPTDGRRTAISIDYVPPFLKRAATVRARQEGLSLRVRLLRWLTNWTEGRRPDEDA